MKSNLPESWVIGTVADIYDSVKGSVDPMDSEILPYIGLEHLSKGGGIESIGSSENLQSIKTGFQSGDVLYGKLRPYLNKHAVVDFAGVCSTDIIVFRTKGEYPARFLDYFFGLPSVIQRTSEQSKGINLPRVNTSIISALEIPIPPVKEAARIVAKLDKAMQRVEASQERLEKLPGLLKQFRQAVLAAAISGRLTETWRAENPQSETGADLLTQIRAERRAQWEEKQLAKMKGKQHTLNDSWKQKYEEPAEPDTSELPELPEGWVWTGFPHVAALEPNALKAGPFGSALKKDFYTSTGYKIYGQEQVIKQDPYYGDYFIDEKRFKTLSSCRVKPGDILISLVGTIGKALVLPSDILPGIINPRLVKLSLDKKTIVPEYAKIYIDSPSVKDYLQLVSHGGTMDVLNLSILKELPLPLPSFAEQQEIVRQVNHYFTLADALEDRFEQAAALVEQLPQVLLAKAFSGQLVPQDPNDEPASVLLERLRNTPALTKAKRVPKSPKSNFQLELAVPQSLIEILNHHPDGISPEKLFSLAGFTDADVDSFYQELARLQPQLEETKPTGEAAKTWPNTSTTLRIKTQADAN